MVWTAHNLLPDDMPTPGRQRVWSLLRKRFFDVVTDVTMLTNNAQSTLVKELPELSNARVHPVLHHHFADFFATLPRGDFRAKRNISAQAPVLSTFGYIKRYKRVAKMVRAFVEADHPTAHLVVAGLIEKAYKGEVLSAAGDHPRIHILDDGLSHVELADIVRASNACLYNFSGQFNSGSPITALSLDTPAVTPVFPAGRELSDIVGPQWLLEFDDDLTPEVVLSAIEQYAQPPAERQSAMSALETLSPKAVARRHLQAYGLIE